MRYEEILKALECCGAVDMKCEQCPCAINALGDGAHCREMMEEASKLIRNQKVLIECLKETSEHHRLANGELLKVIDSLS